MDVTIPCPCPPKDDGPRHESDTVTLRARLDFHQATSITNGVNFIDNDDEKSRAAEVLAVLTEGYVLHGIEKWTLRDVSNKPVELKKSNIRKFILDRPDVYPAVVEAADGLYNEAVLLPLVARASNSSQPSRTDEPTSPKQDGEQPKRPRPLKRSSTSTTQTVDTGTTSSSLVGVSSFSPSSESAA